MVKTKPVYDPNYEDDSPSKKKSKFTPAKSYSKKTEESFTWLDDRADRIWQLVNARTKPIQIANLLNKEAKLKKNQGCTNKQVSDWINYRKKRNAGQKTTTVSLGNNNLRADKSDSWYDAGKQIAASDGTKLEEDDYDYESVEEDRWREGFEDGCRTSLRFFDHSDEKTFSIFCESGLERTWVAEIADEGSIVLTITIPVPPDELIKAAGYHAVNFNLEETEEVFIIQAPRRFANDTKERKIYYPSEETPLWTIFQYDLEIIKEEAPLESKIDLISKITNKK